MEFLLPFMVNRNTTGNVDISQNERSNTIKDNLVSPASQDITKGANENTQDNEVDQAEEPQYIQHSRGNTVATPDTPNIGAKKRKIDIMLQNTLENHIIRSKERDENVYHHYLKKNRVIRKKMVYTSFLWQCTMIPRKCQKYLNCELEGKILRLSSLKKKQI
ncbi:unnamed protein product [Psylliodes chrysocephalus]|uniref:Uncharacterized protein n=1 Tax=Psylliodes chrysocephalus TaxID=3402493 RepID=A0A9P0D809_9CUCU|nr:unnamed protein product [Psylliodes chrysocephala]